MADFQKYRFRTPPGIPGQTYKDIGVVMAAQADLVESLAEFKPRIVKMAPAKGRRAGKRRKKKARDKSRGKDRRHNRQ